MQVSSDPRHIIETSGLRILNVTESDDDTYTCRAVVIETGELSERNIRVEVQVKPKIDQFVGKLEAIEDQTFSVKCNATGKPVPTYEWIKDSNQLNLDDADR